MPMLPNPMALRRLYPVAAAGGAGLVASLCVYLAVGGTSGASASVGEPMVVTRLAVDDTRPLTLDDLVIVDMPKRPGGSFGDPRQVVGRMPLVPVPVGQPILSSHLAKPGALPGLWHRVPKGMRAVTVAINEVVGVGGFLKPGLRVDIIGVAQIGQNWESHTIAQDVPVLAIAQDDKDAKGPTSARIATSATLLVNPPQAEAISLASERGRIRLVLRAEHDHAKAAIPKPKPKPTAAPEVRWSRPAAPPPRIIERRITVMVPAKAVAPPPAPPPPAPDPGIVVIQGQHHEVVRP